MNEIEDKIQKIAGKRTRKAVKDWLEKNGNIKTNEFGWVRRDRLQAAIDRKYIRKTTQGYEVSNTHSGEIFKFLNSSKQPLSAQQITNLFDDMEVNY